MPCHAGYAELSRCLDERLCAVARHQGQQKRLNVFCLVQQTVAPQQHHHRLRSNARVFQAGEQAHSCAAPGTSG